MTREEAIEHWELLNSEIDDLLHGSYGACKKSLEQQREVIEFTIAALRELDEYKKAESEGRLVVPPCKVGDTVWIKGDKFPAEIEEIRITDDGIYFAYVEYDRGYEETEVWDNCEFTLSDIGKTVFLTREEAEKALED